MRFINILHTKLPMGALSSADLKEGDKIIFEVEVMISEPSIVGFNGVVSAVRPVRILHPTVSEIKANISD